MEYEGDMKKIMEYEGDNRDKWFSIVTKGLLKGLGDLEIRGREEIIQTTAL